MGQENAAYANERKCAASNMTAASSSPRNRFKCSCASSLLPGRPPVTASRRALCVHVCTCACVHGMKAEDVQQGHNNQHVRQRTHAPTHDTPTCRACGSRAQAAALRQDRSTCTPRRQRPAQRSRRAPATRPAGCRHRRGERAGCSTRCAAASSTLTAGPQPACRTQPTQGGGVCVLLCGCCFRWCACVCFPPSLSPSLSLSLSLLTTLPSFIHPPHAGVMLSSGLCLTLPRRWALGVGAP